MLSSDTYGVIAKMDMIETDGSRVIPVDYKRGRPREEKDGSIGPWEPERVQIAAQALILRDNGYACDEAIIYYGQTKQRVRVAVDDAAAAAVLEAVRLARETAQGPMPPPLVDSPKCPRCSLVPVCLPDETNACSGVSAGREALVQLTLFDVERHQPSVGSPQPSAETVRRLVAARDELKPLYLNTQGLYVGKSGQVLQVKEKKKVIQEVRLNEICQVNLMGNIQMSTQAIQTLCQAEVPIAYFSMEGWFYGVTEGLGIKNIFLRREQFRLADVPAFCLSVRALWWPARSETNAPCCCAITSNRRATH